MIQKNFTILLIIIIVFFADIKNLYFAAKIENETEVVILSVLHQIHGEVDYYSFEDLSNIIEKLQPSVLVLELTPSDLKTRKEQRTKLEYQKAIFPLIDKHGYKSVAMEPAEPLFTELVSKNRKVTQDAFANDSSKVQAFGKYVLNLLETLKKIWISSADVNSNYTDRLFEAKHILQSEVLGPEEADVWNEWNMNFLDVIKKTAEEEKGGRVVVIVGAEHSYWLREKLKKETGIKLLDTFELISS